MKVNHVSDTDTLFIDLNAAAVDESRDLVERTPPDPDDSGCWCVITIENASARIDVPAFSFGQVPSAQLSA